MPTFERIIPVLTYQDIPAAHDFLVRAFGFAAGGVHRSPEGQPIHGEVRAGDAPIWLHRVTAEHHLNSPRTVDVANSGLVVHIDDVDAHHQHARAAGAQIDGEPDDPRSSPALLSATASISVLPKGYRAEPEVRTSFQARISLSCSRNGRRCVRKITGWPA